MKQAHYMKGAVAALTLLLVLNLVALFGGRVAAQPHPAETKPINYKVVRIDSSTNEDLLFQHAGEEGLELVGTIQVFGNTGYLIFKK
jgi:hypothetical protein